MVVERQQTKTIVLKEVPKIADMDFMGANKTRIVISESAMAKETAAFEVVHQAKCNWSWDIWFWHKMIVNGNGHFEVHQNIAIPQ